jgi:CHASE3 domain sensor protein
MRVRAREAIVRKFTNYRNRNKAKDQSQESIETMKETAAAFLDIRASTQGRSHFKRRKFTAILARRDQILEEDPGLPQVAAFQKAFKEMWNEADQEFWEEQASSVRDESISE